MARHFGVKPPSIYDWFKKGSISKEKLPNLFQYFSDVVGPEHWGLDRNSPLIETGQPKQTAQKKVADYVAKDTLIDAVVALMRGMSRDGKLILQGRAEEIALRYRPQTNVVISMSEWRQRIVQAHLDLEV